MSKPASIAVLPYPISDESRQKKRLVLVLTESDGFGDFPAVTSKAHHAMAVSLAQDGMKSGSLLKPSWIRTD